MTSRWLEAPCAAQDLAAVVGASLVEASAVEESAHEQANTIQLSGMTHDSRKVVAGTLFACVPGAVVDGHDFADQAVASGAVALLVERPLDVHIPQLQVPSVRAAMGPLAAAIYGNPSEALQMLGVTGTSGKTTVTQLLHTILDQAQVQVESLGTLSGARTTPEAPDLQATLADMASRGVRAVAMEVSSHALDLHRVDATQFSVVGFTNLGHDHLDFHGDLATYQAAKSQLFRPAFAKTAVINTDDEAGRAIAAEATEAGVEVIGYGIDDAIDLAVDGITSRFLWRGHEVVLRLAGTHNVLNALLAAEMALAIGLDPNDIADGLCRADAPRGRFEFVGVGQDFHVVVDYAHKPEAVSAVLAAARSVADGHEVIAVLGAGGDRDREKRSMMGAAVAAADRVVITSDNPRTEDPNAIISQIVGGVPAEFPADRLHVVAERREAIVHAIASAGPGDMVLIAGKGHETYQEINGVQHPFDDREVAIEAILGRKQS